MTTENLKSLIASGAGLFSTTEAASYLGVTPATLAVWRSTGRYAIRFFKVGGRVRYRQSDLDAWLESRVRESGATA